MTNVRLVERPMTEAEFARMNAGFAEHQIEHGNIVRPETRHTYVATDDERFIGRVSGLRDNNWYDLSDLWIEQDFRRRGIGRLLLECWEKRVAAGDVRHVYTWTAGYEAPGFYARQGYEVFAELENYFSTGHSRVGLRKTF